MIDLLALSLIVLAAPVVLFADKFAQWGMRLLLTEAGRRPETVAELQNTVTSVRAEQKTEPSIEHAQAA